MVVPSVTVKGAKAGNEPAVTNVDVVKENFDALAARIMATQRNIPVRNIYRDNGFIAGDDGMWRRKRA